MNHSNVRTSAKPSVSGKHLEQADRFRMHEIKHMLLSALLSLKDGKKTPANADAVLKYANAYEKLFKREKMALYMQDAFDRLTNVLTEDVERASSHYQKKRMLFVLQRVREKMEGIMEQEFGEIMDE